MAGRRAFTLLEVMISVAILGLSVVAGLRLLAVSSRALEDVHFERKNLSLARSLWLKNAAGNLEQRGRESDCSWEAREFDFDHQEDVPEGFSCSRITLLQTGLTSVRQGEDSRSFIFYLPDMKTAKERAE